MLAPEAPEAVAAVVEAWGMVAAAAALEDRRLEYVSAKTPCYTLRERTPYGAAAVQKEVTWLWTVAFSGRLGQLL